MIRHSDPISKVSRLVGLMQVRICSTLLKYNSSRNVFLLMNNFLHGMMNYRLKLIYLGYEFVFGFSHLTRITEPLKSHTNRTGNTNVLTASSSSSKTAKGNYHPISH